MDRLERKLAQLQAALVTLGRSVESFRLLEKSGEGYNPAIDYQEEYRVYRDSMIQRFEYSIDIFWKALKAYFESKKVFNGLAVPSEVIRTAFSTGLISEDEAEVILDMLKSRNQTSHIHVEEVAELLAGRIPIYHKLLEDVSARLSVK